MAVQCVETFLRLENPYQYRLIELLDRGSLKYPSSCVIDITKLFMTSLVK